MSVTIHDVAKHAGVGIGTVSSVLNSSRPVKQATRQKVLDAIEALNFVPNPSGRRLSMGKTHTIAVIIPYLTTASQVERLRGVMSIALDSGYDVNLYTVENAPQRKKILQTVPRRGRVDGLLIFSLNLTDKDSHLITQQDLPTVLIESSHAEMPHIYIDDIEGARKAVEHLIELGHRKIGYISDYLDDPLKTYFSRNRYQGYCQALKNHNLPLRNEYHIQGQTSREEGYRLSRRLLSLPDPPTAIFAFSDEFALGVIEAARDLNIQIPEDLSVIGYDDIELAQFVQLTTIRQHLFDSGVHGAKMLLNHLNENDTMTKSMQFPTELIVRQTTASPKRLK